MTDSYDKIDRFLRNNLDDSDYADFAAALDSIASPSVVSLTRVEILIREMSKFADVKISQLSDGRYFVSIFPSKAAPLWWYASNSNLETALQECRTKAVQLNFMKE